MFTPFTYGLMAWRFYLGMIFIAVLRVIWADH